MLMDKRKVILLGVLSLMIVVLGIIGYQGWRGQNEKLEIIEEQAHTPDIAKEGPQLSKTIKVHICGEVKCPDVYEMKEEDRVIDAIRKAGGETEYACLDAINLAAPLYDGQQVMVPTTRIAKNGDIGNVSMGQVHESGKININTADGKQMQELDGIGEKLAQRIIDYRNDNGPFNNLEDLKKVSGIGDKKYESVKEQITLY